MKWLVALLAAAFIATTPSIADGTRDVNNQCLASAIYHEARGEPLAGQRAVYDVIVNRMRASGSSACGVVSAKGQFSWYGFKPILPYTAEMRELVERVRNYPKMLHSERWFFTVQMKPPKWAYDMRCRVIGNHKFCREGEDG